jgi:hypothetical protein
LDEGQADLDQHPPGAAPDRVAPDRAVSQVDLARRVSPRGPAQLLFTLAEVFLDQVRVDEHGPHVALLRQCLDPAAGRVGLHRGGQGHRVAVGESLAAQRGADQRGNDPETSPLGMRVGRRAPIR